MKKFILPFSTVITLIAACNKEIERDLRPASINAAPQSSDLTLSEKVWNVKNTGVYSDTCSIARRGHCIVLEGNSIFERAIYSNWKATWISKGYPILNRAIGGTTWSEKTGYIKDLATAYRPNDIMWYDGDNEFLRAKIGDTSVAGKLLISFNSAMDKLRSQNPNARIYVMSLVTSPALFRRGFASQITRVNNGYKSRVERDASIYPGKIKFVDVRSYYPYSNTSLFEADLIHIKLTAYTSLYNAMKEALPKPNTGAWGSPIPSANVSADTSTQSPSQDTTTTPPPAPQDTTTIPEPTGGEDTVVTTIPGTQPPIANAGADITIGKSWNYNPWLYGTSSKDPDGYIAAFKWTFVSYSGTSTGSYTIVTPNAGKTRLDNLSIGVYVFQLTVTDNKGAQAFDEVKVTVSK